MQLFQLARLAFAGLCVFCSSSFAVDSKDIQSDLTRASSAIPWDTIPVQPECRQLPCLVATTPIPVLVDGYVQSNRGLVFDLSIHSPYGLAASVKGSISQVRGGVRVFVKINRVSTNPWQLPPLDEQRDLLLTSLSLPGGVLPTASTFDAVSFALLAATMDPEYTLRAMAAAPYCHDETQRRLGSDGPLQGFLFIPWFTSDAVEACAIKHDECFRNSPASGQKACDKALSDCVIKAIGIGSRVYSEIALFMVATFGSLTENADPCQCRWKVPDWAIPKLIAANDTSFKVSGSQCCTNAGCLAGNPCDVAALGSKGEALVEWKGECVGKVTQPHVGSGCNMCHQSYATSDAIDLR